MAMWHVPHLILVLVGSPHAVRPVVISGGGGGGGGSTVNLHDAPSCRSEGNGTNATAFLL